MRRIERFKQKLRRLALPKYVYSFGMVMGVCICCKIGCARRDIVRQGKLPLLYKRIDKSIKTDEGHFSMRRNKKFSRPKQPSEN